MALWIEGGQVIPREVDGVTLHVRVLSAGEMVRFLKRAEAAEANTEDGIAEYQSLIVDGLTGWDGEGAPPFSRESVEAMSMAATQRAITTIIETNTLSVTDQGNSHVS